MARAPGSTLELLTSAEMGRADRVAIESGVPGRVLMERAGTAVVSAIVARWAPRPVLVLCGPGNNGGDGFVAARLLAAAGWPVRVMLRGDRARLSGDAAWAAGLWDGPVDAVAPDLPADAGLVIDALFGAGLARPVEGPAAALLNRVAASGLPCVAVDVPSGVHGDTGTVLGTAAPAALTVTFFRRKPGHLLLPGRTLCGPCVVADIGIPETVLAALAPTCWENGPRLWRGGFPRPALDGHKYSRGHAVVVGGARMTGAARLAAQAARRVGAGLVTVAAPEQAVATYAAGPPGLLIERLGAWPDLMGDPRKSAVLIGPGAGGGPATRRYVLSALEAGKALVLDADSLTAFAGAPADLFAVVGDKDVLTPHEGEFARLFPDLKGDKLTRARAAAAASGGVIVLKGADTVIAAPDGRAAINANAPATLATAGTGDVLAGMVLGLRAQGMAAFDAAAAAVWLHGAAATAFGPGLIAEDVIDGIPGILAGLDEL
ncbi:MAG: NAD(P)H-hydrate dehydratase [Inquilinaceae bacterium]